MQFIDTYIQGKYNPETITYDHELTRVILEETYGIAVYQEQVMQLVQACAGFSLGQADIVRRAMGKKKKDLLDEQKAKFVAGCSEKGIDAPLAGVIWDKIETFAGYGFNKSHSVAYAFVAYQTAYLKANYPVEFMCALLTSESGNLDKVALYVDECRRMKIDVLPPDINHSWHYFAVDGQAIRFGLGAIKNVGEGPIAEITRQRTENGPFTDIFDMCKRLDTRLVNRRCIESLNQAGAFAGMGWNRRQVEAILDQALGEGQSAQRDRDVGQFSLFDMDGMEDTMATMHQKPDLPDYPDHEVLQMEKEMLGLYISSHPLDPYLEIIDRFGTANLASLSEYKEGETVFVAGSITSVRIHVTKTNKRMAFVALETRQGLMEVTVFSDTFEQKAGIIAQDMIVMIPARVNYRNDEPGLVANDVFPIEDAERYLVKAVHVKLEGPALQGERLQKLAELLGNAKGDCDVYLHCTTALGKAVTIHATEACLVPATRQFRYAIEEIAGMDSVWCTGGMGLPTHRPEEIKVREQKPWERKKSAQSA